MMRSKIWILLGLSFWVLIFGVARSDSSPAPDMVPSGSGAVVPTRVEWPVTEGAPGGGRYSPLAEIDRSNVAQLEIVWTYHHGDAWKGRFPLEINRGSAFESTPSVVDGRLFFTTPRNRVVALDPETGRELWTFDPQLETGRAYANRWINRGVAYWRDATSDAECSSRLFLATLDARLIALDARTGRPCGRFGREGSVDLAEGIAPLHDPWEYGSTSPPTVVGDRVVVGSSIADTIRPDAPSGEVRAFDARTGEKIWTFRTIPRAGEPGAETWGASPDHSGAANVWSTITADLERGLVFLPVSTASPDYYGGERPGDDLFSDSIVALDAATGTRRWHFQTVHHDLWDYDLAAPPVLATLEISGRSREAVVQATKHGFVFVLDRETGEPLFPVEERRFPASDVPGERTSPTQPVPIAPPPLIPQRLSEKDLHSLTPSHEAACRKRLAGLRNEGLFTPPSEGGSLVYPFSAGGANWSGAALDPVRRRLFVPVNNLAQVVRLDSVAPHETKGRSTARPLRGVGWRSAIWFLTGRGTGERYRINPLWGRPIFEIDGVPCNRPPWSEVVAVDLERGSIAWRAPTATDAIDTVKASFGPALVTAGGVLFHAGTSEPVLRAHDVENGRLLATFPLPAGLHAGPISYRLRPDGPQFLVVAPGGDVVIGSPLGDSVIAYALPRP
jgi:quinoprotein glucose dehydrogenase